MAAAAVATVGFAGLAFDLGRMYVARSELQVFCDAASLAAAERLDGSTAGIQRAKDRVSADPNRWNFGLAPPDSTIVDFSLSVDGPFEQTPLSASDYRFVRLRAEADVPTSFMRLFPGVGASVPVSAQSVAGQLPVQGVGDGVMPFSPDAHDALDVTGNYGFLLGKYYTLRWDNKVGNKNAGTFKTSIDGAELVGCPADMDDPGFQPGETSNSQRGYIDLSNLGPLQSAGGASLIRETILSALSFERSIVPYAYWINPEPGEKQKIISSMDERVAQDTDPITPRYYSQPQVAPGSPSREDMNTLFRNNTTYRVGEPRPPLGNGRRIVVTPVNDPLNNGVVVGFAGFLLPPKPCDKVQVGPHKYFPCCGEYIGPVTRSGGGGASSSGGLFEVVLAR